MQVSRSIFKLQCNDVEVCHDEMAQECDTEYFQKCSAEMKEECFGFVKVLMKYKTFPHSIPFNLFHEVLGGELFQRCEIF